MLFEGPREHSLFVWGRQERQKQGVGAQRWGESERVLASSGQVELDRFGWEGHHNKPIHVRENGQGTHSMGGLHFDVLSWEFYVGSRGHEVTSR